MRLSELTSPIHQVPLPCREAKRLDSINWLGSIPFFFVHVVSLGVLITGATLADVVLCVFLYYLRMFAITGGYHRYFSHRSYKTGRLFQFFLALLGTTALQKGPLWWAGHHRAHHRFSDQPNDVHSPRQRGLWWAHLGWILCRRYEPTDWRRVQDFARFPEIRWLNRWHLLPPIAAAGLLFWLGGWHALLWGGFMSTVLLWHGTFTINSLSHVFGSRRYATDDDSRNNLWLALLTMGEGWHNNHHRYQSSVKQGFFWWEIDMSYYILKFLSWIGLVWDLRHPPAYLLTAEESGWRDEARAA
ncbi:MAG: acyl-CoA desaturase [Myxococcales bacterium]|nr:acyl-CoA desaturase [Myxococcota bacterium]MDW8281698.1 acyl-CoA desaturase [Myxococcales bacterium]